MCPLRFILVFFSAIVAGYVAWRSLRSSSSSSETEAILDEYPTPEEMSKRRQEHFNFTRIVVNGFWVFLDMASGNFLWRNLKEIDEIRDNLGSSRKLSR